MNQQCKVCGEPAAGFHFGAFTCEGCKSFFGRTYNNLSSISECKNNGECVINKKNRTACKACRLRKCLYVGMSKSGSRYGRRSNWFKIHCLLQEQQQQHQHHQQQQHQQHHDRQNDQEPLQQYQQASQHLPSQLPYVHPGHQLTYPNNNKKSSLASNPTCLLANPFLSVSHLINGSLCPTEKRLENNHQQHQHHHNSHHRTSSSSSDSGASSADPEDSSISNKGISESPISERPFGSSRTISKPDSVRSVSEPLNQYLVLPQHVAISLSSPTSGLLSPIVIAADVQEEPIDLSVKPAKRSRTESPKPTIDAVPKLTPLDLTLVRSNTG